MERFNAEGPDGLVDRKASGPSPRLNEAQRQALVAAVESGPAAPCALRPAVHGVRPKGGQTDVVRWRLADLAQWVWEEHRVAVSAQTLSRELRALGYRKLSARPRHHAQAEGAIDLFKTVSPPCWAKSRARRASSAPR